MSIRVINLSSSKFLDTQECDTFVHVSSLAA